MSVVGVVMLGAPGAGKGTHAEYLCSEKKFAVVAVGELLRLNKAKKIAEIDQRSEMCENCMTVEETINKGILLPDEIVINLVRSEIIKILTNDENSHILFDGFPRTIGQAKALFDFANEFHFVVDKVLNFVVNDDIIVKRILGRIKCIGCGKLYNKFFLPSKIDGVCDICGGENFEHRMDDNEESLKNRLSQYREKTRELVEFYSNIGVLFEIDAGRKFADVQTSVLDVLCV